MGFLEAIVLGILQGLTEFLPVSSSGHIELGKALFDLNEKDAGLIFTVLLHVATALSTIVVFRKEVTEIFKGILKFKWNKETHFAWCVVLSMIPAVFVGLFLKEQLEYFFSGNVFWVGVMLLVTGTILLWSDMQVNATQDITSKKAAILGVVQAIAIMPGISRSGSTIGASILLGIDRSKAAIFSFLMVIPLILGAMLKEIKEYEITVSNSDQIAVMPALAGFLAAAVTGFFACKWMVALVKRSKLSYFAYYCFAVGIISIVLGIL